MWRISERKTPTDWIKVVWSIIVSSPGQEIEQHKLTKLLLKSFSSCDQESCEEYIKRALAENLLVEGTRTRSRSKQKSYTVYALPQWEEVSLDEPHPDCWCYDCHTSGDTWKCEGCLRSFHEGCRKTIEEKQLELEQFVSKQKRITLSSFGTNASSRLSESTVSPVAPEESDVTADELELQLISDNNAAHVQPDDDVIVKNESPSERNVKQEADSKDGISLEEEPEFVCVVRPPNRRLEERLNTPIIKPEGLENLASTSQQEYDQEALERLCYACRLLKNSSDNMPPYVGRQELNYLLNFVIEQYRSWMPEDTFSQTKLKNGKPQQTPAWDRLTIAFFVKMLLRKPTTIKDICQKIGNEEYHNIEQFHVDLLDVAHNVGIIHGATSLEYDSMMYFLADCVYDLFEIRQCPDCYRHSNEKAGPDFFARPCRTRHELVYAKQKSYQYWPAKVIRVVNNKYDVRFFGDKHLRALVDASCVKPIDADPRSLKINLKHKGFLLAKEELLMHQTLLNGPRDAFAFGSATLLPITDIPNANISPTILSLVPTSSPAVIGASPRITRGKQFLTDQNAPNNQSQMETNFDSQVNSSITAERTLKRKQSTMQQQDMKKNRNNNSTSNQPLSGALDMSQQNNIIISSSFIGDIHEDAPANTNRTPRTKQNMKQKVAELNNLNRLTNLLDQINDPQELKTVALRAVQEHIARFTRNIEELKQKHKEHISEVKKKQWCATCEMESVLACCWNTSYCSKKCQEKHWPVHLKSHQTEKIDAKKKFR